MQSTARNKKVFFLVAAGMMAALVFVGNYMQITIPVQMGSITRIHLGNSMCLLAGLLFGPLTGGLASGIGGALFDLLHPEYIASAPITFLFKFVMGFLAGWIARGAFEAGGKPNLGKLIAAAVVGQLSYMVLYLAKSFAGLVMLGNTVGASLAGIVPKVLTSSVNALAAVIISVPLSIALYHALRRTGFASVMEKRTK